MSQLAKLSDYEDRAEQAVKDVNRGMERFAIELKQIKDSGLWNVAYDSFEDYCKVRWGKTVRTVQRALKAHTTRQKLLAVASSSEKPVIEAASTRKIEEVAKSPEDQQMAHLVIGRNQPKATKLVDFYSSGPSLAAEIAKSGDAMISSARAAFSPAIEKASGMDPVMVVEHSIRLTTANLLRTYPLKDESHRPYLNQLAGCIEKGEPA